jgi:hypothetical protein
MGNGDRARQVDVGQAPVEARQDMVGGAGLRPDQGLGAAACRPEKGRAACAEGEHGPGRRRRDDPAAAGFDPHDAGLGAGPQDPCERGRSLRGKPGALRKGLHRRGQRREDFVRQPASVAPGIDPPGRAIGDFQQGVGRDDEVVGGGVRQIAGQPDRAMPREAEPIVTPAAGPAPEQQGLFAPPAGGNALRAQDEGRRDAS